MSVLRGLRNIAVDRYLHLRERWYLDYTFIHINKTGGSSIEKALGLRFEHRTALEKRAELGSDEWERRFTFTFVRNPWDRLLSQYHYRSMEKQGGFSETDLSFAEWVQRCIVEHDQRFYNNPKMFMPQLHWLVDDNGQLMVDFVGRFENLAGDFETVCSRIQKDVTLPHLKRSSRPRDFRSAYDPKTLSIVSDWFAADAEAFGYSFDPDRVE